SLALPALSGAEKAERQLLRALFSTDWRSFVLGRVHPDLLLTRQAKEIFALAARVPARDDGSIDPAQVFREAEALDAARAAEEAALYGGSDLAELANGEGDPGRTDPTYRTDPSDTSD